MMNQNYMRLVHSMNRASAWENLKSISFDGVDEYLTGSAIPEMSNATDFTVSFWCTRPQADTTVLFNLQTDASNQVTLAWRGAAASHGIRYLQFAVCNGSSGNLVYSSQNALPSSGWSHVAARFRGSGSTSTNRARIFVDGVSVSSSADGTIPTSTPTFTTENFIVASQYGTGLFSAGKIDELRIYGHDLSNADILDLYNSGVPKADDLSTLAVHKYRMGDGDTYPTIEDSGTGTAIDLTMTNMESGDINTDVP